MLHVRNLFGQLDSIVIFPRFPNKKQKLLAWICTVNVFLVAKTSYYKALKLFT